jgi:hypothetical protein
VLVAREMSNEISVWMDGRAESSSFPLGREIPLSPNLIEHRNSLSWGRGE